MFRKHVKLELIKNIQNIIDTINIFARLFQWDENSLEN